MTLAEALPRQQQRARDLLEAYTSIGPQGSFGATMIREALARAERAAASGDIVAMIRACKELEALE